MSVLYPTKTRLSLLRQVSEHRVLLAPRSGESFCTVGGDRVKVTVRINELAAAGWVWRAEGGIVWRISDYGRQLLDGAS